jgi:hypothetical protein
MHAGRTSVVFRLALDLAEPLQRGAGPPPLQEQDGRDSEEAQRQRGGPDAARFIRLRRRRPGRRRLPLLLQRLPPPVASPHRHDPLPRSHELAAGSSLRSPLLFLGAPACRQAASEHRCRLWPFLAQARQGRGGSNESGRVPRGSGSKCRRGGWLPPTCWLLLLLG